MDNEKVFIELPSEAEVQAEIQTIMKRGMQKHKLRKKKIIKRNSMLTAAAILIFLLVLDTTTSIQANRAPIIPFIGEVVGNLFTDTGFGERVQTPNLDEFAIEIGQAVEMRGLIFTIDEAVFDGVTLFITYTVLSETKLEEEEFGGVSSDFAFMIENVELDGGERTNFGSLGGFSHLLERISEEEYLYAGFSGVSMTGHLGEFETIRINLVVHLFYDHVVNSHGIRSAYGRETARFALDFGAIPRDTFAVGNGFFEGNSNFQITNVSITPLSVVVHFIGEDQRFTAGDNLGEQHELTRGRTYFQPSIGGFLEFSFEVHPAATELILTLMDRNRSELRIPIPRQD